MKTNRRHRETASTPSRGEFEDFYNEHYAAVSRYVARRVPTRSHDEVVAAVFVVGQAAEGNVLTPLLVGDRVGLHPVWVIFALLAGAHLMGFLGVLIAVPVAAIAARAGVQDRYAGRARRRVPLQRHHGAVQQNLRVQHGAFPLARKNDFLWRLGRQIIRRRNGLSTPYLGRQLILKRVVQLTKTSLDNAFVELKELTYATQIS